jgi:hypothetical protein
MQYELAFTPKQFLNPYAYDKTKITPSNHLRLIFCVSEYSGFREIALIDKGQFCEACLILNATIGDVGSI